MKPSTLFVELGIDAWNSDLHEQMKRAKVWIEQYKEEAGVVALIRGFDDDERELFQIPEVRAFCKRLIDQGFISYLEFCTTHSWQSAPTIPLGAVEVICIAESKGEEVVLTEALIQHCVEVVTHSNAIADKIVGKPIL